MSIFEYDEEKHLKSEREFAYNAGMIEGEKIGVENFSSAKKTQRHIIQK